MDQQTNFTVKYPISIPPFPSDVLTRSITIARGKGRGKGRGRGGKGREGKGREGKGKGDVASASTLV